MNTRQSLFVEEYLKSTNATDAAKRAGYSEKTAYSIGQRLLKNVEVAERISERTAKVAMSADEVLERLAEYARNDAAQYIRIGAGGLQKPYIDVAEIIADGRQHLIKGISYTRNGDVVVELYDAHAALVDIGRHHKLFTDRVDIDDTGLTDDQRATRILALLDRARARRAG